MYKTLYENEEYIAISNMNELAICKYSNNQMRCDYDKKRVVYRDWNNKKIVGIYPITFLTCKTIKIY